MQAEAPRLIDFSACFAVHVNIFFCWVDVYQFLAAAVKADSRHVYELSLAAKTIGSAVLSSFRVTVYFFTSKTALVLRKNAIPSTNGRVTSTTMNVQRRITCAFNSTAILHAIEDDKTRPSGRRTLTGLISITGNYKA